MSGIVDFFTSIIYPLEWGVAWVMVKFHALLTAVGMDPVSGWTWSLSIVGLVVVLRILLIPLFVKQIKASRGMQLIQPEMRRIQQKYKGKTDPESRQAMSRETMELYRANGTNPFASCLPALLQAPFFFALFRVLNSGIRSETGIGPLTEKLARQAGGSSLLGAQLTDTFTGTPGFAAKALTLTLIVLMSATMFLTQRQLMMKNMPASALDNPFAQQQKILLYAFPVIFLVTGINFPLGVLVYWLTTNLWTGAQQFYVIRRMPAPGSPAEKAMEERRRRRGRGGPRDADGTDDAPGSPAAPGSVATAEPPRPVNRQRQQPQRKNRGQGPAGGSVRRPAPSPPPSSSSPQSSPSKPAAKQQPATKQQPAGQLAPGKPAAPVTMTKRAARQGRTRP